MQKTTFYAHEAYSQMKAKVSGLIQSPMDCHTFTFSLIEMEDEGLAISIATLADIKNYCMLVTQQLLIFIPPLMIQYIIHNDYPFCYIINV